MSHCKIESAGKNMLCILSINERAAVLQGRKSRSLMPCRERKAKIAPGLIPTLLFALEPIGADWSRLEPIEADWSRLKPIGADWSRAVIAAWKVSNNREQKQSESR